MWGISQQPAQLQYIRGVFMDEYGAKLGLDEREVATQFGLGIDGGLPLPTK